MRDDGRRERKENRREKLTWDKKKKWRETMKWERIEKKSDVRKWDVNEKMVKVGWDRIKREWNERKGMTNVVKVIVQVNKLNDI